MCGYSLEAPHWGTYEYSKHMFLWTKNNKNISGYMRYYAYEMWSGVSVNFWLQKLNTSRQYSKTLGMIYII